MRFPLILGQLRLASMEACLKTILWRHMQPRCALMSMLWAAYVILNASCLIILVVLADCPCIMTCPDLSIDSKPCLPQDNYMKEGSGSRRSRLAEVSHREDNAACSRAPWWSGENLCDMSLCRCVLPVSSLLKCKTLQKPNTGLSCSSGTQQAQEFKDLRQRIGLSRDAAADASDERDYGLSSQRSFQTMSSSGLEVCASATQCLPFNSIAHP